MHESTPDESQTAEGMIGGFGTELRRLRAARGEQLEDIAAYLQIKPTHLYGIEQGDLSAIPGLEDAKICLRRYADYLGLKGNDIVTHMAPIIERLDDETAPATPTRLIRLDRISIAILASSVILGGVVGWSYISGVDQFDLMTSVPAEAFSVTGPEGEDVASAAALDAGADDLKENDVALNAEPDESITSQDQIATDRVGDTAAEPAVDETDNVALNQTEDGNQPGEARQTEEGNVATSTAGVLDDGDAKKEERPANVLAALVAERGDGAQIYESENTDARVIIRALATTWVQVSSKTRDYIWTRTMQPKEMLMVPNRNDLELWTGDAGGVEVLLDGTILPPLGPPGTVIRGLSLGAKSLEATSAEVLPQSQAKPTF